MNGAVDDAELLPAAKNELLKSVWQKLRSAGLDGLSLGLEPPLDDSTELAREQANLQL